MALMATVRSEAARYWALLAERFASQPDREEGLGDIAADLDTPVVSGKQTPEQLELSLGVSGTPILHGFVRDLGEYNPLMIGRDAIPIYEKMRRSDAQVHATLMAVNLPVQSAKWDIVPGLDPSEPGYARAKEICDFVKGNLFGGLEFRTARGTLVSQAWDSVVRNALLMPWFGVAAHEDVYVYDGGRLRLRKLAPRLPLTFWRFLVDKDDGETLEALEQYGYTVDFFKRVQVPAEKLCLFVFRKEGANFWGLPLLRSAYPHWYAKNSAYRIDLIAAERNTLGVPTIEQAPNASREDRAAAAQFVTQLAAHERTGISLPAGWKFTIQGVQGNQYRIQETIREHNEQISNNVLAMFLNLASGRGGSRALAQQHTDFFLLALQNLADQIARDITATTITRLTRLNFGEDAAVPRLVAANVQSRQLEDVISALTQLAQAGVVVPDESLDSRLREELGLPQRVAPVPASEQIGVARRQQATGTQRSSDPAGRRAEPEHAVDLFTQATRTRDRQSPYWHAPVAPTETHVDFRTINQKFDQAEAAVADLLRRNRRRTIRQLANRAAEMLKNGQRPSVITYQPDTRLEKQILAVLQQAYDFAKSQVLEEHRRLLERSGRQQAALSEVLADVPRPTKNLGLIAEVAVEDYGNRLALAAQNAANDLRRSLDIGGMSAGEIADELFGALDDISDGYFDNIAAEGVRTAMGRGRNDALEALRAELGGLRGFWERTSVMDKNRCSNCAAHDGDQMPADGPPPPPPPDDGICEGGHLCRCQWIEVIP
jgi:hypothetical protein